MQSKIKDRRYASAARLAPGDAASSLPVVMTQGKETSGEREKESEKPVPRWKADEWRYRESEIRPPVSMATSRRGLAYSS